MRLLICGNASAVGWYALVVEDAGVADSKIMLIVQHVDWGGARCGRWFGGGCRGVAWVLRMGDGS